MHKKALHTPILATILAFLVSACVSTGNIKPYLPGDDIKPHTEGEMRLWSQAEKINESIKKSGQLYENEKIRQYVQSVVDKLYPEFKGNLRVQLLKAPVLNAFVLPDGSVYVNKGILAACENEAQMASILAHEGVHFINKHSSRLRHNSRTISGAAVVLSIGLPIISQLVAVSSMFGYSRDLEREADSEGFFRMKRAGYDIREAPGAFELLALEATPEDNDPFFFSTHPRLEERIENFNTLLQTEGAVQEGEVGKEPYQKVMADLRLEVLRDKLDIGKYDSIITVLTTDRLKELYPETGGFFLGEAYRLRNNGEDSEKAITAYKGLITHRSDHAQAYRSLGIVYLKEKKYEDARFCLEKYLKLNPAAEDKAFIDQYLKEIDNREKQDEKKISESAGVIITGL